jgi:diguanylate cyclase (GGDEF)-like protein
MIMFGVPCGIITAAVDAILSSMRMKTRARRLQYLLFNTASMSASAMLAGTLFFLSAGRGPLSEAANPDPSGLVFPLGVLGLAHYLFNSMSVATIVALDCGKKIRTIWKDSFLWTSITYFAGAGAAGFIAIAMQAISIRVILVILLVLFAVYYTYKTYLDKVSQLNTALTQVNNLAYYDVLTDLPNRLLFTEHLNRALSSASPREPIAVMFLDLDRFKRINDTFGHGLGDKLLKVVAERLQSAIGQALPAADAQSVCIGRFGGDEFTLLIKQTGNLDRIAKVAQHIMQELSTPVEINGHEMYVTSSIGISLYPDDGRSADVLLRNADTAMYFAKSSGRGGYCFYSNHMNEKFLKNLALENDLRKATEREQFEVYYQPKLDARTRRTVGFEALIRWRHPSLGMIEPSEFIAMAEETELIIPINEWVLRSVCKQTIAWQSAGLDAVPVAVNLSCVQFKQKDLPELVAKILRETKTDPKLLELEITESTIMQNEEEAGKTLRALAALGVRLSIDDFGTGYSSLSYLKRFELDTLKIDRSFVKDVTVDADDRAITTAIIAMAHSLGLRVVAEGVETEEQLAFLREYGCDELQGYLFSRPLPVSQAEKWLSDQGRTETTETGTIIPFPQPAADQDPLSRRRGQHHWRDFMPAHTRRDRTGVH